MCSQRSYRGIGLLMNDPDRLDVKKWKGHI